MKRVLMVCTGNICRSTMAHQVLAEAVAKAGLDVEVDSAGVSDEEHGNPIDRRAARVLRENGHGVPDHRARQIRQNELGEWDLILTMTGHHLRSVNRLRDLAGLRGRSGVQREATPEIRMFREFDPQASPRDMDLPDPWYGGHEDFVETLEVIERATPKIVEYLRTLG
ncbi:low molecular weight protein-tyrosine-phosphatase [Schaalia vaccimaxillae]|uniref:low molecular weight protein-tyrosine-phosphatase n=1 Tax=Schaalia vaccimaxillae TaxID=183916 RepID=UPI0003B5BF91|nr:low molecular weight protein-tyrosine-phosphatase [Schaalia vaccimaxillae]